MDRLVERMLSELSQETMNDLTDYCYDLEFQFKDEDPLIVALIAAFKTGAIVASLKEDAGIQ